MTNRSSDIYTHPDPVTMVVLDDCCPECGAVLDMVHYFPTFAHPECHVPTCIDCGWQGDPK